MDKKMSNFEFIIMSFAFNLRDIFINPNIVIRDVEIKPGYNILDFGCGTGSYSFAALQSVGEKGKVYALDILPLALQRIKKKIEKKNILNMKTICSYCSTGLKDDSIDIILLFDTFHMSNNQEAILKELSRIMKTDGVLCFNDHHMKEDKIISTITNSEYFFLSKKSKRIFFFKKKN